MLREGSEGNTQPNPPVVVSGAHCIAAHLSEEVETMKYAALPLQIAPFLILLGLAAPVAGALDIDPLRYQGGVRNSPGKRSLDGKQLAAVIRSLREKTGLLELDFDADGFLRIGDPKQTAGGSQTARELLAAAVESEFAFDLECHSRSAGIAFGRLGPPVSYQSRATGLQIEVVPLDLDFVDFERLRGDKQVISSFDLGMVILHELGHGVLRLHDARSESEGLGECEAHMNRIRRELGLPERQNYFARVVERPAAGVSGGIARQAELVFTRETRSSDRTKRQSYVLSWDASQVGSLATEAALDRMRSGETAMR